MANQQLFGVTATFNEEAYTTPLDRNAPDFKEREAKAIKIANEIQNVGFIYVSLFSRCNQLNHSCYRSLPPIMFTLQRNAISWMIAVSMRKTSKPMFM